MILRFSIECGPSMKLDDEQPNNRMTPEVAEDYMRRMREQVIAAYQEVAAFNTALDREPEPQPEGDD